METKEMLKTISKQGNGYIYLGVVGSVRTGKSTFIKKVIETLVVPNISDEYEKKKCLDEIPQSSNGKQIMTTEPKFVPSNGANIKIDDVNCKIKLIDCVGYIIDSSIGYEDSSGNPRLVNTPWYDDAIPFIDAATIGTEKVINDHATIGVVITTDGSFGEFKRDDYIIPEEKVISELKKINKPFIVIVNTADVNTNSANDTVKYIKDVYDIEALKVNINEMNKKDINDILKTTIDEFPIVDVKIKLPEWIHVLSNNNDIKTHYLNRIRESICNVNKVKDVDAIIKYYTDSEYINRAYISELDASNGIVSLNLDSNEELYDKELNRIMGDINLTKATKLKIFSDYKKSRDDNVNLNEILKMTKKCGYGIMHPELKDMILEKPVIIKQGNKYGIKLSAKASSIHMLKIDVNSTFEPIIGTEEQSKELINYIMKDYDTDPTLIWKSEIFGRSLESIVKEGIQAKLNLMSDQTRYKLTNVVTKIVNKGSDKLIAIVI